MSDIPQIKTPEYGLLSRLATYTVILAWIILGLYIYEISQEQGFTVAVIQYFLSVEQAGVRFHALILLAPFILTVISYLINERTKLIKKTTASYIRQVTHYDVLTQLPNRALFLDEIMASIARAHRQKDYMFAILFLDLDRFKNVNDSLGHEVGDQLLIEIAGRLKKHIRPYDTVARVAEPDTIARFGGDEFAILLSDVRNIMNVISAAKRLQYKIKLPINISGRDVYITASIGITVSRTGYEKPEDMLRDADTAVFKAKDLGRDCHVIFDETLHTEATSYLKLENNLRRAVEKNAFFLNYQPIISCGANEIAGFEALLRCKCSEGKLISPAEFIPVAEETGLIIPIGRWVLGEACRHMLICHEQFPSFSRLAISVNISTRQFTLELVDTIKQVLDETGLSPDKLNLEITESVIMRNPEIAAAVFIKLKELNIKVHMDDFGTGYSSLGYLHKFPLDALKIDRSFVQDMCDNEWAMEIVKTIISMAHNMKMEVIAEGVEAVNQLEELRKLKCDFYQGYLFSKPLDKKDMAVLLENGEKL